MSDEKTPRAPQAGEKYVVRFPDGMRDRIAEEAKKNKRSMNAEIIERLSRSFEEPMYTDDGPLRTFEDVEKRLQNIARKMDLKLRMVKANTKARAVAMEQPPMTPKKTIPKK